MKKIEITKKQAEQFNMMRFALIEISKEYKSASWIQKNAEKQYGLESEEALEMSYDNIQALAKSACKGVKPVKFGGV